MSEITLTWKRDNNNDLETRERVKKYFESNHLNCQETSDGLYITCDDENKAFSYMWDAMYNLAKNDWFRDAVKSCVWRDGDEAEDVIKSTEGLFVNGKVQLSKIVGDENDEEDDDIDEVTVIWKDVSNDLETHERVKKYFESNHLNCQETSDGLYITCDDEVNAYSYMWLSMMDLAACSWFRKTVKSCVWRCGWEWEDVIVSTAELIEEGAISVHD